MSRSHKLALLVGIDTESDNQWDAAARAAPTFENLYALPTLHALFRQHGVRPTYVITHPVARDARSAEVLRKLRESGTCEIGAHHHAWETPPCSADDVRRHPYALQLPIAQFEAQLDALTQAIEEAVGERPVSYRSGRFGFSAEHVSALERGGYTIDSSVAPLFYESHKGGPDFVDAPLRPYFLAYDNATRPGSSQVLELPISSALNRRLPAAVAHAYARAPRPYTTKRVLKKLGVAHVVWLRPSYSSVDEMIALARRLADEEQPLLNLLFHSSEAIVGGSPYNRTQAELAAFCDRLNRFLAFATRELNATPMTFREFRASFLSASSEPTESLRSSQQTAAAGESLRSSQQSASAGEAMSSSQQDTPGREATRSSQQGTPGREATRSSQEGTTGREATRSSQQDTTGREATRSSQQGVGRSPAKDSSPLPGKRGEGQG